MEGVGSFLCEQRRGAEEELLARPQLQMEVGHSALLTVNQCKSFNANLRVKIMQRHLFWGNTVYDFINLSLCVWSSQSELEPPG